MTRRNRDGAPPQGPAADTETTIEEFSMASPTIAAVPDEPFDPFDPAALKVTAAGEHRGREGPHRCTGTSAEP